MRSDSQDLLSQPPAETRIVVTADEARVLAMKSFMESQ